MRNALHVVGVGSKCDFDEMWVGVVGGWWWHMGDIENIENSENVENGENGEKWKSGGMGWRKMKMLKVVDGDDGVWGIVKKLLKSTGI